MQQLLSEYKGFVGAYEFDEGTGHYISKILNCPISMVSAGRCPISLKKSFEESIDSYLLWCKVKTTQPVLPYLPYSIC